MKPSKKNNTNYKLPPITPTGNYKLQAHDIVSKQGMTDTNANSSNKLNNSSPYKLYPNSENVLGMKKTLT